MASRKPNGWNPYTSPPVKSSSGNSGGGSGGGSTKLLLCVGVAILLVAIAGVIMLGLLYTNAGKLGTSETTTTPASASQCPCDWSKEKVLFFPYGSENGDWEVTDLGAPVVYFVSYTIGYTLFGNNGETKPIGIKMLPNRGLVNVGPLDNGKVSSAMYGKLSGAIVTSIDTPVAASGQYILHRKANGADLAKFKCLFPEKEIKEAYIFTWIKVKASGNELGSFQIAVIFLVDSTTYLIRNYDSDIQDVSGQTELFKIVNVQTTRKYNTNLKAADVKGKRQSFVVSAPVFGTSLVSVTESQYSVCPA